MPPHSRQTYVRRRIVVFGGLLAVLAGGIYLPMTLLAPLEPAVAELVTHPVPVDPEAELAWPASGASAIGAVGFSGVLETGGEATPRSIASITKIITSLVVLEAKPLAVDEAGPSITMTGDDVDLYHDQIAQNGSTEPVTAGLELTQRQLIEVVLVASANNYAESLVRWAYGSEPEFLTAAQAWLAAHGLNNTTLYDATGLDPENKATASDIVELGKIALENPLIAQIVAMPSTTLPYIGTVENTNKLLGWEGVDGIKTGTVELDEVCLLFATTVSVGEHSVDLVGVILGAGSHDSLDAEARSLITTAVAGFHELTLVRAGDVFARYSTPWEQSANAVATKDESVLTWAGTPITEKVDIEPFRTAESGERVGSVTFTIAERTVTIPIALDAELGDPGPWWRLTNPFGLAR